MLAQNIKILREASGERQEDLAKAIGTCAASICYWERENRVPAAEHIENIAIHYKISVEALLQGNFSDLKNKKMNIDVEKNAQILFALFPRITTTEALADKYFYRGDCYLKEVQKNARNLHSYEKNLIENAYEDYYNSWEENGTIEAMANIVSILLYCEYSYLYPDDEATIKQIKRLMKSGMDIPVKLFLTDAHKEKQRVKERISKRKEVLNIIGGEVDGGINILKKHSQWWELGDYFVAVRYFMCLDNVNCREEISRIIGLGMLQSYARMGNRYARQFLGMFDDEVWKLT